MNMLKMTKAGYRILPVVSTRNVRVAMFVRTCWKSLKMGIGGQSGAFPGIVKLFAMINVEIYAIKKHAIKNLHFELCRQLSFRYLFDSTWDRLHSL